MAHHVREHDVAQLAMFGLFGGHLRIQPDSAGKETTDRPKDRASYFNDGKLWRNAPLWMLLLLAAAEDDPRCFRSSPTFCSTPSTRTLPAIKRLTAGQLPAVFAHESLRDRFTRLLLDTGDSK
jgi:hypothetical protein